LIEGAKMGTDISGMKKKYRQRSGGDFPSEMVIKLQKEWDLKYGENPNQHAAMYFLDSIRGENAKHIAELTEIESVRSDSKGKGGLSLNNMMDITRAMDTLKYFVDNDAVAIMKHTIVSGFAKKVTEGQTMTDLFRLARDTDRRSNFGGTAVFTDELDMETAKAMYELKGKAVFFVDVVAAPSFGKGVLEYLEAQSANLRIASYNIFGMGAMPKFIGDDTHGMLSVKDMPTGRIGIQDIYLTSIKNIDDFILHPMLQSKKDDIWYEVEKKPTGWELDDLLTAWRLNIAGARSNGVVFVKNGVSVAMGSGQVERVGAVEQAIIKGMQKAMDREGIAYDPFYGINGYEQLKDQPFKGAVCASDAFFPFPDSIERLSRVGVTAVTQPFGSQRDISVIKAANKYGIAMPATLERCFGHF